MSNPHLPPEILDHIVDLLQDDSEALKECCLVSKSWIPRTRTYLFAEVNFPTVRHIRSWRRTFPDHSTSPARYVKTLSTLCKTTGVDVEVGVGAEVDVGDWIGTFSRVVHLWLGGSKPPTHCGEVTVVTPICMAPLHKSAFVSFCGFSPVLRSLRVASFVILSPHLFNLVLSFPLLEDLAVGAHGVWTVDNVVWVHNESDSDELSTVIQPQISPAFTGSLALSPGGMEYVSRGLLSLPGGIHFRKLTMRWYYEDGPSLITALIEKCCHTLEFLDIQSVSGCTSAGSYVFTNDSPLLPAQPGSVSVNLSKATSLKALALRPEPRNVKWVSTALQTITLEHQDLRKISIYLYFDDSTLAFLGIHVRQAIGEEVFRQWLDIDHFLAQLWESHSIHPEIMSTTGSETEDMRDCIACLLPQITKKRMAE